MCGQKTTEVRAVQSSNAFLHKKVSDLGNVTEVSPVQSLKAWTPMVTIPSGNVREVSLQALKEDRLIPVREFGSVREGKPQR